MARHNDFHEVVITFARPLTEQEQANMVQVAKDHQTYTTGIGTQWAFWGKSVSGLVSCVLAAKRGDFPAVMSIADELSQPDTDHDK